MDLGTANTLVYIKNQGIVLNEPSVVAVSSNNGHGYGDPVAVGLEAKQMYGRTHNKLKTIRPMKDGVIADFEITNTMIKYFIQKTLKHYRFIKPRMVVGIPTCITQVEKKAVIDAATMAGVRDVYLVEEPMAAAIGVGIPSPQSRRQHGGRYRGRNHRRGCHLPFGHRLWRIDPGCRRRTR